MHNLRNALLDQLANLQRLVMYLTLNSCLHAISCKNIQKCHSQKRSKFMQAEFFHSNKNTTAAHHTPPSFHHWLEQVHHHPSQSECLFCFASLLEVRQQPGLHSLIVAWAARANSRRRRCRLEVVECSNNSSFNAVQWPLNNKEWHSRTRASRSKSPMRHSKSYKASFPWKKVRRILKIFNVQIRRICTVHLGTTWCRHDARLGDHGVHVSFVSSLHSIQLV